MLSVIWTVFLCMALLCGAVTGRLAEVTAAVPTGAAEAITLAISITGLMCFWSGVMELLQASGLAERLSRLMAPVLRPLFGSASQDKQAMEAVSANERQICWGYPTRQRRWDCVRQSGCMFLQGGAERRIPC